MGFGSVTFARRMVMELIICVLTPYLYSVIDLIMEKLEACYCITEFNFEKGTEENVT